MKPTRKACLLGCAVFAASLVAVSDPAGARIECRGNFQMTKYGPIATPYCEEKQIAIVARSYGVKVTDFSGPQRSADESLSLSDAWQRRAVEGLLRRLRPGFLRSRPLSIKLAVAGPPTGSEPLRGRGERAPGQD